MFLLLQILLLINYLFDMTSYLFTAEVSFFFFFVLPLIEKIVREAICHYEF